MKRILFNIILIIAAIYTSSCNNDKEDINIENQTFEGGYLFAHMQGSDYGSIYYSVSKDAKQWLLLNDGNTILPKYSGHPDIIKGRNDRYYMIGATRTTPKTLELWESTDLTDWKVIQPIPDEAIFNTPGYKPDGWYSAPKLYFDVDSDQYIITWHASRTDVTEMSPEWWAEMRSFYMLTKDFNTYSTPERIFDFKSDAFKDMATIDVIVRKIGDSYYAVLKDERSNDIAPTGKTVLISKSPSLTGPYSEPISVVTPMTAPGQSNNWHEAPSIVEQPDGKGWFIFAERYPVEYARFDAPNIESKTWTEFAIKIPETHHGCFVRITNEQYDNILAKFGF